MRNVLVSLCLFMAVLGGGYIWYTQPETEAETEWQMCLGIGCNQNLGGSNGYYPI